MTEDNVQELTGREFDDFVKKGLVFIDFFAEWCMPCLMMAPVIEELSDKFKGKIRFGKVNVDENQKIAQKFNVSSIPTFILFRDGVPMKQFVGSIGHEEFREKLKQFL